MTQEIEDADAVEKTVGVEIAMFMAEAYNIVV